MSPALDCGFAAFASLTFECFLTRGVTAGRSHTGSSCRLQDGLRPRYCGRVLHAPPRRSLQGWHAHPGAQHALLAPSLGITLFQRELHAPPRWSAIDHCGAQRPTPTLLSWASHNQYHQLETRATARYFFTVLEPRSPKYGRQQDWFLLGAGRDSLFQGHSLGLW